MTAVAFGRFGQFGFQFGDAAPALLFVLPALFHQIAKGLRQSFGGVVVHRAVVPPVGSGAVILPGGWW